MPVDGFESVGQAFSIAEDKATGALYLPSVLHGTLESTDDGRTWRAVDPKAIFANYKQNNTLVWEDDTTMYARVVDGFGFIYQIVSTDLGRTWKQRSAAHFGVKSLSLLADGTVVEEYRFNISTNYGRTWKNIKAEYDTNAFHYSAILVAPRVAAVWDTRGNWYEVDCLKDTTSRHRIKDRLVHAYHLFDDGSYIAVAYDSWRWYSKDDSLLRKQVDTVIGGKSISLGGSKLVTTGKRWLIVTRNAMVVDVTSPDFKFVSAPSESTMTLSRVDVRDNRLVITTTQGTDPTSEIALSEYNTATQVYRIAVRARADMIGDIVELATITTAGTPIVLTKTSAILRHNDQTGEWAYCPVTELNIAPQPITVIGAIPTTNRPGFALVTSSMQPYRMTAPSEFVVDSTRLPEGSFVLRSVGHTLRTTCHRIITTPDFFWRNGYDMTGTVRNGVGDTTLCRECHAYLESTSSGLTFSGTRYILRKNPKSVKWDTLKIDSSRALSKSGYVSDIVESAVHNTIVAGLRGYDVQTSTTRVDSVRGGLWWSMNLGINWYPSEASVALDYVHSLTRVGSVIYAVTSNAVFSPEDVGPDKDVGAMAVDSVAVMRSTDGGSTFDVVHLVHYYRALHMHDMRIVEHGGRLYTCLQDQRIWVSDDGKQWDQDIDQPQPQGNVLSLTGIGDSIMILATTRGAFILEKTVQVGVTDDAPSWQPLTAMRYSANDNAIIFSPDMGAGQLIITDLQGRSVEHRAVAADTRHLVLSEARSGTNTATFVTADRSYRLVFGRVR